MKKIIVLILTFIMLVCAVAVPVSAAPSTSIALSTKEVIVNGKLTVTVTVNAEVAMYSAGFNVGYNADILRFDSGNAASGGAGVVKVAGGVTGLTKTSFVLNFTALKSGSSSISVSNCIYVGLEGTEQEITGSAVNVTVKDETKSDNANLYSLRIDESELNPAFSPNVTSYTATIPYNVTVCKVYTRTEDSDAKVSVEGSSEMKVGKNTRTVVVTAPNGNQKKYTIVITREDKPQETSKPADSSSSQSSSTSSEDTSSIKAQEALERRTVLINGASYEVLTNVKGITLPTSFNAEVGVYNEENVAVAKDSNGKYTLYYLKEKDTEKIIACTLDSEDNSFREVGTLTFGDKVYILEDCDDSKGAPVGTSFSSISIKDYYVNGFTPEDEALAGFYYITCYLDGVSGYYRYDSQMDTLQREPALKFAEDTVAGDVQATESEPEIPEGNLLARFAALEPTAKTVVIALALIVLVIIVLIVLVIVGSIRARREEANYFDDISETEPVEKGFIFEGETVEEVPAEDQTDTDNDF